MLVWSQYGEFVQDAEAVFFDESYQKLSNLKIEAWGLKVEACETFVGNKIQLIFAKFFHRHWPGDI